MTKKPTEPRKKPAPKNKPPIKKKKYTDVDLFQAKVDEYFIECDNNVIKKQVVAGGKVIVIETPEPYTMAGLAHHLNIHRDTLNNYSKDEAYVGIVTHARKKIERYNINLAMVGCYDSKIAALNLSSNFGYAVKKDVTVDDVSKPTRTPEEIEAMRLMSQEIVKKLK